MGVVFVWGRLFNVDPDLWWHLKVGETILRTHHWPTTDIYSFTVNGQPWLAYEWLGDVLLAGAYRLAGLPGLAAFLIVVGSAVVIALYSCATAACGNSKAGFVAATLLSIFAVLSFSPRPQMLGYLFLVLTLTALELFRARKAPHVWFFPAMMLVWVNTHGSWIIGMGAAVGLLDERTFRIPKRAILRPSAGALTSGVSLREYFCFHCSRFRSRLTAREWRHRHLSLLSRCR